MWARYDPILQKTARPKPSPAPPLPESSEKVRPWVHPTRKEWIPGTFQMSWMEIDPNPTRADLHLNILKFHYFLIIIFGILLFFLNKAKITIQKHCFKINTHTQKLKHGLKLFPMRLNKVVLFFRCSKTRSTEILVSF